jgi:hypothetical protein
MSESSSVGSGNEFVRRCCAFYLCALVAFWIFAVGQVYARARLRNIPFSVSSLFVLQGRDTFRDFLNFDPVAERFVKQAELPTIVYPAPMMCVYLLFTRVSER